MSKKSLMQNVFWAFGSKEYKTLDEFTNAVTEYNNSISPDTHNWEPDCVIFTEEVNVSFEAGWKDDDDIIEFKWEKEDLPATMASVLLKLNNEGLKFFADTDYKFFEGLTQIDTAQYKLDIGS